MFGDGVPRPRRRRRRETDNQRRIRERRAFVEGYRRIEDRREAVRAERQARVDAWANAQRERVAASTRPERFSRVRLAVSALRAAWRRSWAG